MKSIFKLFIVVSLSLAGAVAHSCPQRKSSACIINIDDGSFNGVRVGDPESVIIKIFGERSVPTTWPDESQRAAVEINLECGAQAIFELKDQRISRYLVSGKVFVHSKVGRVQVGSKFRAVRKLYPKAALNFGLEEGTYVNLIPSSRKFAILFSAEMSTIERAIASPKNADKVFSEENIVVHSFYALPK